MKTKTGKYGCEYKLSFRRISNADTELLNCFNCEYPAIRDFIQSESLGSKTDVSYILVDEDNNRIVAFSAIKCTGISVLREDKNGNEYLTSVPAIEIDYFAVDELYRSLRFDKSSNRDETLSKAAFIYLIDTIEKIATENVGATHICLYSVPKAKNFYKRCGFEEFEEYMNRDEVPFLDECIPMFRVIDK